MSFEGFPEEALEFYEGLEADNTKAYWTDHKAVYDRAVAAPLAALLAELSSYGEAKVFRPYRDVRFSKDKTPYHLRANLLRHTALIASVDHAPAPWLHTAKAKDRVRRAWDALAPSMPGSTNTSESCVARPSAGSAGSRGPDHLQIQHSAHQAGR